MSSFESSVESSFQWVLLRGDARLADLGALLVLRHWLRCELQQMAGLDDAALYPFRPAPATAGPSRPQSERCSRLFF